MKIDVPYVTRLREEVKIYEKDFNPDKVRTTRYRYRGTRIPTPWASATT